MPLLIQLVMLQAVLGADPKAVSEIGRLVTCYSLLLSNHYLYTVVPLVAGGTRDIPGPSVDA